LHKAFFSCGAGAIGYKGTLFRSNLQPEWKALVLEILLLYFMGKKIAETASDRGRPGVLFVILLVGLWFGGELAGFVVGAAINHGEVGLACYGFALLGAMFGAITAFIIVNAMPVPVDEEDEGEKFDIYGNRIRRRRRRDSDREQRGPRIPKSHRDEDEAGTGEDRPLRRRRRDGDERYTDRPRPRRRADEEERYTDRPRPRRPRYEEDDE
jgi:hypothetical protein